MNKLFYAMFFTAVLVSNGSVRACSGDYPVSCYTGCCAWGETCCGWNKCCDKATKKEVGPAVMPKSTGKKSQAATPESTGKKK